MLIIDNTSKDNKGGNKKSKIGVGKDIRRTKNNNEKQLRII